MPRPATTFLVLCLAIGTNQLISWIGMFVLGRTPIRETHVTLAISDFRVWNLNAYEYNGYGRVVGSYPNSGSFTSISDTPPTWLGEFPYRELAPPNVDEHVATRLIETCGWPLACCYAITTIAYDPVTSGRKASINGGIRLETLGGNLSVRRTQPPSTLPYRPIWKGYVTNSAIWFVAIQAITAIWRWRYTWTRLRRGDCVQCGYHVGGLERCPECGAPVPQRRGSRANRPVGPRGPSEVPSSLNVSLP